MMIITAAAALAALVVPAAIAIYGQRYRRATPRPLAAETMERLPDGRWAF
jgi:hypothetical protein